MGWTVFYQVIRAHRFDEHELAAVSALERDVNAEPWDSEPFGLAVATRDTPEQVIARGFTKLAMNVDESTDASRICDALTRLQRLVPDACVLASDDFGVIGWDEATGFSIEGGANPPVLDVEGEAEWKSLDELVPPPAPKLKKKLAAALAAHAGGALDDAARHDEAMIVQALELVAKKDGPREAVQGLLRACDADAVARVGLSAYGRIHHGYDARRTLADALRLATDRIALAPLFLAAWSRPKGLYFYSEMDLPHEFAANVAAQPAVTARLIDDMKRAEEERAPEELVSRCAERAAELLARSGQRAAIAHLVGIARRWRRRELPRHVDHYVLHPAIEFLGRWPHPLAAPSLVLALDGSTLLARAHHQALLGVARARPEIARDLVASALDARIRPDAALEAAVLLRDTSLLAVIEPFLAYPDERTRDRAAEAVEATTGTRLPARAVDHDPESLLLHRDLQVRHAALRAIGKRADPALFLALAIAEWIDAGCQKEITRRSYTHPIDWRPWNEMVPREILDARDNKRLEWAIDVAPSVLGEQRMLAAVAPWVGAKLADAVAALGPFRLTLDAAKLEQMVREEAAAWLELGGTEET